MSRLFLTNIPYNCHDTELRDWIESHGFDVDSVRVVRDMVTGVSPAFGYVSVRDTTREIDPVKILDGRHLKGCRLQVTEDWRNEYNRG